MVDWYFKYNPGRYIPTDMASFGININLLYEREDIYFERYTRGDLEGVFLKKYEIKTSDFEPKAENCKRVKISSLEKNKRLRDMVF